MERAMETKRSSHGTVLKRCNSDSKHRIDQKRQNSSIIESIELKLRILLVYDVSKLVSLQNPV